MTTRNSTVTRKTRETNVHLELCLDGEGRASIQTGVAFLDHMLENFTQHAGLDLSIQVQGDLHVDDHHSAEDVALCLGQALDECLGNRAGIRRFGSAYAPLDESLARVVIDFSGRPMACVDLGLKRERLGDLSCENIPHFLRSLASSARLTLHADVLRGENDHHRAEASFKALALALREAITPTQQDRVPSTKGRLQ